MVRKSTANYIEVRGDYMSSPLGIKNQAECISLVNLAEVARSFRHESNNIIDRKVLNSWMDKFSNGDTYAVAEEDT